MKAAAATGVRPLITAEPADGVVLGVFSTAVIIRTVIGHQRTVALLGRDATGLPNGVRVADATFAGIRPGQPARIGAGIVEVGNISAQVVRWWDSRVRTIQRAPDLTDALARSARGVDDAAIQRLESAMRTGTGMPAAVAGLIGLGLGLTPGGDDVVAGLMTGLHAVGRTGLARHIGDLALQHRTTLLSADLLRLARDGHACLEALAVLRGQPVDRLLSVGHTSGADLATGMAIALRYGRSDDATHLTPAGRLPRLGDAAQDLPDGGRGRRDQHGPGGDGDPVEHRTGGRAGLLDPR